VLGGMGSLSGTIIGTSILIALPEWLRGLSDVMKEYRMLIYSIMLVSMMLFRPQGIMGTKEITVTGIKNFFRKIKKKIIRPTSSGVNKGKEA
ncbi:MAG: branched-chain amino acid ABC transporter permease, partial [Anaerotignum sp.]|nr:branched-chain amino acid ABC transporter permease [Anaerotignum sp.]